MVRKNKSPFSLKGKLACDVFIIRRFSIIQNYSALLPFAAQPLVEAVCLPFSHWLVMYEDRALIGSLWFMLFSHWSDCIL